MRIGIDSCRDYVIEWNMYTLSITVKSGSRQDQYHYYRYQFQRYQAAFLPVIQ